MGASGLCGRDVSVEDAAVIRWLARIPRTDGFARRMATVYAPFFLFGGIQMPYVPAWLQARGLDPRKIGIVPAAPMLIRIVAVPLAAAATLGAAGYAVMAFAGGFMAILAAYAAISVLSSPVRPLPDADGLRGLEVRGVAYGEVRLWGSPAFILANMAGRHPAAPTGRSSSGLGARPAAMAAVVPVGLVTAVAALRRWRASYPT
jgi:hypothetical protein